MNASSHAPCLAELAREQAVTQALLERIATMERVAESRVLSNFDKGLHRGRRAALGWLFVGAASGALVAFAIGFSIFW